MFVQPNNTRNPEGVLQNNQLEALKSLSSLLVREINSLGEMQSTLEKEIEAEHPISLLDEVQYFEARMIRCALVRSMGSQKKAAKLLGLKPSTFHMKLKRHKIDLTEF